MRKRKMAVAALAAVLALPVPAQTGVSHITLADNTLRSMVSVPCNNTKANYVKLNVTKLGLRASTDKNNMYCQLAEIEIYDNEGNNIAPKATFTSTDAWNNYGWNISCINNGVIATESTGYTSSPTNNATVDITITAALDGEHQISRVVLYPRQSDKSVSGNKAANFPSSYSLSLSTDGTSYTEMVNVSDADAPDFTMPADAAASFNNMLSNVDNMLSATDVYADSNDAVATLKQTVSETATKAAAVKCTTDMPEQIKAMAKAVKTFVGAVTLNEGKRFDLTLILSNPSFDSNATDGWSYAEAPGYNATGKNAEYFEKDFDCYQTLTDMPNGWYVLNVQAFERIGTDNAAAYTAYKNGTDEIDSYIYLNNGNDNNQQAVKNLMAEGSATQLYTVSTWQSDVHYDGDDLYRPNSMPGAAQYFAQNMYDNEVTGWANGDLTIGIKGSGAESQDWTLFDNFRLYYYGSAKPVALAETADFAANANIDNATVTLSRTIKANVWNTIVLPFSLTDSETKVAFGDDAKVARFSENSADATKATVNFNIADDASIEANVPVLLKTSTAGTEYTFTGRAVKALNGEAKAAGTNFSFVGSYAATVNVPENAYFISNNRLYASKGTTTLKGTRAYIAANGEASGAKVVSFAIDNNEAMAIDGVLVERSEAKGLWTLDGRRVSDRAAVKGLFIKGKKKVIIK